MARVYFRTTEDYQGEFGFDWLREKDNGLNKEPFYDGIVLAGYGNGRQDVSGAIAYEKFKATYKAIPTNAPQAPYYVPYLTLFSETFSNQYNDGKMANDLGIESIPVSSVSLRMLVAIEEDIERLEFEYNKNFLRVIPEKLADKYQTQGLQEAQTSVSISCLKDMPQNEEINIYAYPKLIDDRIGAKTKKEIEKPIVPLVMFQRKLAGRILVLKNDQHTRKNLNITVIKVTTNIGGGRKQGGKFLANERGMLFNGLHQALIVPTLKIIEMDMSRHFTSTKNYVFNGLIKTTKEFWTKLHEVSRNTSGIVVFSFDVGGINSDGDNIAGSTEEIGKKFVAIFKGRGNATLIHEILHALGLYHTHRDGRAAIKDANQRFIFPKNTTDNLMSYNKEGIDERKTTWKWQWEIINPKLK